MFTYIETSVISYYTGQISSNLVIAAQQKITHDWWHIVSGKTRKVLTQINNQLGILTPTICTPNELMEV